MSRAQLPRIIKCKGCRDLFIINSTEQQLIGLSAVKKRRFCSVKCEKRFSLNGYFILEENTREFPSEVQKDKWIREARIVEEKKVGGRKTIISKKGIPQSKESNLKRSITLKKRYASGVIHPCTGKHRVQSPEERKKRSESHLKRYGAPDYVNPLKGRELPPHTEEDKKNISIGLLKRTRAPGYVSPMLGRMVGDKNPNWHNGTSFEPYGIEFNGGLKKQIRNRDNHICQECGLTEEELGLNLSVHHVDYNKKNNNPENLISLCRSCHSKTGAKREGWIKYFQDKMLEITVKT